MRKSIAILSLLVMAMLTPLSHAESPIAKYFGSVDGMRKIVSDSLGAATHNNLAGLQGGTTGSYYHAPPLKRFLLPADVDTTVAGEAGNNVEVSRDVFASVHPDSGQVICFMPEDAAADPDTISAVVFDQVFDPGDSLIFYADADTAGQSITVTITGTDGTVILNQTATSADDQGYVRYAYAAAATVTQQEYRIVYKFIGYLSHWMKVSRVTVKRAG